jgi:light-regulated signal transduction histidine kinase (bacteriophytochrome)
MTGICQDITPRRQAEEELKKFRDHLEVLVGQRTAQLEAANKELEAFSYSVSHDLRAPLRAIDGYTRILMEDYAVRLDDEGQRVCKIISDNAKAMGQLIDDLLAFSRIGRAAMQPAPVDMATLARSIFFELTTEAERARIDFQVGDLPYALVDAALVRHVWMNLLASACIVRENSRGPVWAWPLSTGLSVAMVVTFGQTGLWIRALFSNSVYQQRPVTMPSRMAIRKEE